MKLVPLNSIFDIEYGNQFDLYKMDFEDPEINFVSRSSQNLGVVAKVSKELNFEPYPAGLITVTLGGTYLLSSFVQQEPFYTAQNIKVLTPKKEMDFKEKVFYCMAIQSNRFRYTSHGREANVTLDHLLVPAEVPAKWLKLNVDKLVSIDEDSLNNKKLSLDVKTWKYFELVNLFEISASSDELMDDLSEGGTTPYITSTDDNNGVTSYVKEEPTNSAGTITANRGGSVGYFFYQPLPYKSTPVDVRILTPKFKINPYIGLFLKTILQLEKYRYNYSRKMGSDRLSEFRIKLPALNTQPDWQFMEDYIKSLPYSASI
jgi:hypothetical protein